MNSVAVIGAGAWGTALAIQAARSGCAVSLWARDPARAEEIARTRANPRLSSAMVPEAVNVTADRPRSADAMLLAVPMQHLRDIAARLSPAAPLVVCAKGVEASTGRFPLEVLEELHPSVPRAVLTGPNFAHEIAAGQPAATVLASTDALLRARLTGMLATPGFRIYGNDDPIGAQVGGAAKNVIAIAAGAVTGAGLGENARAALITRGLAELARLAVALGGRMETVMGLSGLGDLLLTCTGPASRNFSLGLALGRGARFPDALAARAGVAEGVATAPALISRAGAVDMPICRAVAGLLAGDATLGQAIAALLARPRRDE